MSTIEVPGIVPAPRGPWGIYLGLGVFFILLGAFLVWLARASEDLSLWALPVVWCLIASAAVGANLFTFVGRTGRIRVTRRNEDWAVLGSRAAQLFLLTASVLTLLITTGFIIAVPGASLFVWLFGFIGLLGIADSALRLRNPFGWHFNQHTVSVLMPKRERLTFTWDELQGVQLRRRAVVLTLPGLTLENPSGDVASDPAVVAGVLEFYRSNPRSRSELSDARFLERLRSGWL